MRALLASLAAAVRGNHQGDSYVLIGGERA